MKSSLLRQHLRILFIFFLAMPGFTALRAQTAGNLDPAFDPNISYLGTPAPASPGVTAFAFQPDGKTIVAGEFDTVGGMPRIRLARVNADGTPDPTFTSGLSPSASVSQMALHPSGQLLVVATSTGTNGQVQSNLVRLNTDGSVDSTFQVRSSTVRAVAVQPDGKILISADSIVLPAPPAIAGSTSNSNGLIYVGGAYFISGTGGLLLSASTPTIHLSNPSLCRLNPDGYLDPGFGIGSFSTVSGIGSAGATPTRIVPQPDGKILVAGRFTSLLSQPRNRIARLNTDGTLDSGFDAGSLIQDPGSLIGSGGSATDAVRVMLPAADGKILVIGIMQGTSGGLVLSSEKLARLNGDGTLDPSFTPLPGTSSWTPRSIALQTNGGILLGARFSVPASPSSARTGFVKLLADGSLESSSTFDATSSLAFGTSGSLSKLDSSALQGDGRLVFGGTFSTVNGQPRNSIARLLNDSASQSLGIVNPTTVQWLCTGASPELTGVIFEYSTDGGATWALLGRGSPAAGGWESAGPCLPPAGILRARGFISGGTGIVAQEQSFSAMPSVPFTVSAPAPRNGTVTITGSDISSGYVPTGSVLNLTATPATGCDFVNWTDGGVVIGTAPTISVTANATRSIAANIVMRTHTISATPEDAARGTVSGGGVFPHGTQISLKADAAPGFVFTGWTEAGTPLASNFTGTFLAQENRTLVATFAPRTCTIIAFSSSSTRGTVTGGGSFAYGTKVTLVATPAVRSKFLHWSEGGNAINWSRTLVVTADSDRTFTANFEESTPAYISGGIDFANGAINGAAINFNNNGTGLIITNPALVNPQPTVTVTATASPANGGTITGGGAINAGASVTVLATPTAGRTFLNWTANGAVVGTSRHYTFTPSANVTLVANFIGNANANLASLFSDQGRLSPAFRPDVTSYVVHVPSGTAQFTVTPIPELDGAALQINGANASAGGYNPAVVLSNGDTPVNVSVTATDGTTQKTYTIVVKRRCLPGDVNGDGMTDIIFQNTFGQVALWYTNETGMPDYSAFVYSGALGDWRVADFADMDNDSKADYVLQNNAGQIVVWYGDGLGAPASSAYLSTAPLSDWKIRAATDLNGDEVPDLFFQNNAGQIAIWHMNTDRTVASVKMLHSGALGDWRIMAVTDLDGSGRPEIILQNNAGQIAAWYSNADGIFVSAKWLYAIGLGDWRVCATGDLDRDGTPDLIFQNNVGHIVAWRMTPSGGIASTYYLYSGSLGDWRVR